MKIRFALVVAMAFAILPASSAQGLEIFGRYRIQLPVGYLLRPNGKLLQANGGDGPCAGLSHESSKKIISEMEASICELDGLGDLELFGVVWDDARKGFDISTGISQYKTEAHALTSGSIYSAEVDCDDGRGSIYRPTMTCLVFVLVVSDRFLYVNFPIFDHASGRKMFDRRLARKIVESIR